MFGRREIGRSIKTNNRLAANFTIRVDSALAIHLSAHGFNCALCSDMSSYFLLLISISQLIALPDRCDDQAWQSILNRANSFRVILGLLNHLEIAGRHRDGRVFFVFQVSAAILYTNERSSA